MSRTYVFYFDPETVDKLGPVYGELVAAFEERKKYVTKEQRLAMETRLENLRHAWLFLLDKVTA